MKKRGSLFFAGSPRQRTCVLAAALLCFVGLQGVARAHDGKTGACDAEKQKICGDLVQDNILWNPAEPEKATSKRWLQTNLDDLCACTADPYATVNCFQEKVNNEKKTWQEAIAACHVKP